MKREAGALYSRNKAGAAPATVSELYTNGYTPLCCGMGRHRSTTAQQVVTRKPGDRPESLVLMARGGRDPDSVRPFGCPFPLTVLDEAIGSFD
jgi:hypothetical protein